MTIATRPNPAGRVCAAQEDEDGEMMLVRVEWGGTGLECFERRNEDAIGGGSFRQWQGAHRPKRPGVGADLGVRTGRVATGGGNALRKLKHT